MNRDDFAELLEKAANDPKAQHAALSAVLFENQPIPMVHPHRNNEPVLALANCYEVNVKGTDVRVMSYFDGQDLFVAYDDPFVNGTFSYPNESRKEDGPDVWINAVLENSTLPVEKQAELREQMASVAGLTSENARTFFWPGYLKHGSLVSAVSGCLNSVGDTLFESMQAAWEQKFTLQPEQGPAMSLDRLAFKIPVLYEGERGVGKTYESREFARKNGYPLVELAGHESVESLDLLGYYTPDGKGGHVWMDGKLAEAFRKAASGEKTVLLIDELLRIPQRQLSVLLTALTPDTDGCYALSTARITQAKDGVGVNEVIRAPVKNLCVVATTNAGQGYAVDEIDPALAERFIPIRKETSMDQIRSILGKEAEKCGMPDAAEPVAKFYEKMKSLYEAGQIEREPSLRTVVRAIQLNDPGPRALNDVKDTLKGQALLWAARDSNAVPVKEQVEAIHRLADACFSQERTRTTSKSRDQGR